jgi:predicted signal transduction protein with EAL and GGDEF domain
VSIALDDFGTGYSSLASLEKLPLTRVKLDRSLVSDIDRSARALAIARAIIELCAGLGLEVTAEGVERPTQLALLTRERNVTIQGYLVSRPVPESEWLQLLPLLPAVVAELTLTLPDLDDTSDVSRDPDPEAHGGGPRHAAAAAGERRRRTR